jgi:hypothetical protein
MRIERNIGHFAAAVALLLSGAGTAAPPELSLVATRADPNLVLLPGRSDLSGDQLLDTATERFSAAVSQALQSDQRALEQACRSRTPASAAVATRYDWHARCLYRRY